MLTISCVTSFAHFSTSNYVELEMQSLGGFCCRVLLLRHRFSLSLQVLVVAHVGLLLCSPPGDRSCSKLCLRRQIIKNVTSIWAESSFMCGSLFIFIYSVSDPTTFTWMPFAIRDRHVRCERKCFPFLEQQLLNLGLLTLLYFPQVLGGFVLSLVCVSGSCCSAASGQAHLVSCLLPSLSVWLGPFPLCGPGCAGVGAVSCSPHGE